MAVWNQPGAGVNPSLRHPRGVDADGLPSLKVPRIVAVVSVVALVVGVVLFAAAISIVPRVHEQDAVSIDHSGQPTSLPLLEDTEYGFFSTDTDVACTVLDPVGAALDVYTLEHKSGNPPQVLGFRSTNAGDYEVTCTGVSAITINQASVSPEWSRSLRLVVASIPFGAGGLIGTVVGAIWLMVRRRRRTRVMMARLFPYPSTSASAFPGPQPGAPVARPQASYGLAPQQVVYRPLPPPDDAQGT